jgi:DNA-binding beta-propeller fold protein YncE
MNILSLSIFFQLLSTFSLLGSEYKKVILLEGKSYYPNKMVYNKKNGQIIIPSIELYMHRVGESILAAPFFLVNSDYSVTQKILAPKVLEEVAPISITDLAVDGNGRLAVAYSFSETKGLVVVYGHDYSILSVLDERNGVIAPTKLAFDSKGRLAIADRVNNIVLLSNQDLTSFFNVTTDAGIDEPIDLAFDKKGQLAVLNKGTGTVSFINLNGKSSFTLRAHENLVKPVQIAFDNRSRLAVAYAHAVTVFNANFKGNPRIISIKEKEARSKRIAFDNAGRLLVATLHEETCSGKSSSFELFNQNLVSVGRLEFSGLTDFFFDKNNRLVVLKELNNTLSIFKKDVKTLDRVVKLHSGISEPHSIAFDNRGRLAVSNSGNSTVSVFASDLKAETVLNASQISNPGSLAFDTTGRLALVNGNTVLVLSADLKTSQLFNKKAGIQNPTGVAFDGTGRLAISEEKNNRILLFSSDLKKSQIIQTNNPSYLAFDKIGRLAVGNGSNQTVSLFSKDFQHVISIDVGYCRALSFDTNNRLAIADSLDNSILLMKEDGTLIQKLRLDRLENPILKGIAFDSQARLAVIDGSVNGVFVYE